MELIVGGWEVGGGDVADISEDASLSSRGDGGLGDGGARWWARYQLPRV